jgi:uncharacterized protein
MEIDYDPAKNAKNIRERGLDFALVADFEWDSAEIIEDTRKNYGETRLSATGIISGRAYVLVFKPLEGGIRVISFRKANKREVKKYVSDH